MALITSDEVEHFSRIFQGYSEAYGTYEVNTKDADGKLTGKARTIAKAAEPENYRLHLEGKTGIGIIPLLKDDKCWWGAIDLDIKGDTKLKEDHFILEARLRELKLPLLLCKSKSNGAHLYFFGKEPIGARLVQSRLIEFAALLGYGGCEVFPKQITRLRPQDVGNWINLPYFGEERWGIHDGKKLNLQEFLDTASEINLSGTDLRNYSLALSECFTDGPPCLQQLTTLGFNEGHRNDAMFNVILYFKKKYEDTWQDHVFKFNEENFHPPLPSSELEELFRSTGKKDYFYTCKKEPISSHCNSKLCKTKKYGVGGGEKEDVKLPIQSVTKYVAGDSIRWGVNTGEIMIEFSDEEFFSLEAYRRKFAGALNFVLGPVKYDGFLRQLDELVKRCETIYDAEDASESGQILDGFESWFHERGSAPNADSLVKGHWWQDPETNYIYFRQDSLLEWLGRHKNIKKLEKHKIFRLLVKEHKIEKCRLNIKGVSRRVWRMPSFEFENKMPLEVPNIDKISDAV